VAATPLNPTNRYFPPGTRKTYWLIACANYLTGPTRAELNAGTDLTAEISAMTGFSVTVNMVDTPDLGSSFTSQIGGRRTSGPNDITFYLDIGSNDVRTLLPRGTNGFVVQLWEGDVAGRKMSIFPAQVTTQAPDTATDNPGGMTISFAASKLPAEMIAIPA
jgi:hypothetical protein